MADKNPTERLTDEQRQAIIEAYAAGEPTSSIAKRFGVSPTYPGHLAASRGVPRRQVRVKETGSSRWRKPRNDTEAHGAQKTGAARAWLDDAEVRRLSALGMGLSGIAAKLRAPYKHVASILDARDAQSRPSRKGVDGLSSSPS